MSEEVSPSSEQWGSKWALGLDRPWIRTDEYTGPDRRCGEGSPPPSGERRVRTPDPAEISPDDFPGQNVFK